MVSIVFMVYISAFSMFILSLIHVIDDLSNLLSRIKIPYPLQWGAPTFEAGHAFGMMAGVLVSLIEVTN